MKPRAGAARLLVVGLVSLLGGAFSQGCLVEVAPSADEAIEEGRAALDECTHGFAFTATPSTCNDAQASGVKVRAGAVKVAKTGCEVVDIETFTSSCEAATCSTIKDWPAGHEDARHKAAAEAECTRICESPGRDCVSFGVSNPSLSSFGKNNPAECWDGSKDGGACGDDPEEDPQSWVKESPCVALVGSGCGTAIQRHEAYACLCRPPDWSAPSTSNPLGGQGEGAQAPGCHCELGAPGGRAPRASVIALAIAGLAVAARHRRKRPAVGRI